jgi:eukaryotic-like serine/threonine-protein kinase
VRKLREPRGNTDKDYVALEILATPYSQLDYLGHGARSKILLIVDERTGQKYALKRVVKQSSKDDRFIEQTENEYVVSRDFQNPILRKSYSLRRIRRWLRLAEVQLLMEYVPGRNLETFIHTLTPLQMVPIFTKVAEGLHSLHQMGFVHADVKPNNILVDGDNQTEVHIIDFGQSCRMQAIKERVQGTPGYIAPEQVRCEPLDQRTDVFNLGATMYYMMTGMTYPTIVPGKQSRPGQRLVPGESSPTGQLPEQVNPKVPKPLSLLIMDCCRDNAAQRPADMRQVLDRLEIAQTSRPTVSAASVLP